jgi:hypothetical protein
MKRTVVGVFVFVAGAALFAALVHAVLVAAHLSESSATTVRGLTPRRIWASSAVALGLTGVIAGGLAVSRPASRVGTASGRLGIVALSSGLIAVVNGWLNLALASGGPGSGNGVVGGAAAVVLGLIALLLAGARYNRA